MRLHITRPDLHRTVQEAKLIEFNEHSNKVKPALRHFKQDHYDGLQFSAYSLVRYHRGLEFHALNFLLAGNLSHMGCQAENLTRLAHSSYQDLHNACFLSISHSHFLSHDSFAKAYMACSSVSPITLHHYSMVSSLLRNTPT